MVMSTGSGCLCASDGENALKSAAIATIAAVAIRRIRPPFFTRRKFRRRYCLLPIAAPEGTGTVFYIVVSMAARAVGSIARDYRQAGYSVRANAALISLGHSASSGR